MRARARWDTGRSLGEEAVHPTRLKQGPPAPDSGQLNPRHIEAITGRCYLPVLAGFVTLNCAGTDHRRQAARRPVPGLRGLRGPPWEFPGGDDRDRTGDLLVANEALSQLSYIPTDSPANHAGGESGIRTHEALSRLHGFQPCSFSHSDISPEMLPGRASDPARCRLHGGERGIRTLDTLTRITVFETARFSHSRISPRGRIRDRAGHFQPVLGRRRGVAAPRARVPRPRRAPRRGRPRSRPSRRRGARSGSP